MTVRKTGISAELILERAAEKAVRLVENSAAVSVDKLANAVEKAAQRISDSEINASKRIAEDAAQAAKALIVRNADGGSDHDNFLTFSAEVRVKLDIISKDIREIKEGTAAQLIDHDSRIKKLENKTSNYFITMTLYSIALGFLISLVVYHLIK
jgi:nickel-dependent lactate racemase